MWLQRRAWALPFQRSQYSFEYFLGIYLILTNDGFHTGSNGNKHENGWCKVNIYPTLPYKRKCWDQADMFEDKEKSQKK